VKEENKMEKQSFVKFETPETLEKKILDLVENSYRSGKIKKGTNEVIKSIERGESKIVIIAEDVTPPEVVYYLPMLCEERKVAYAYAKSKSELGTRVGISAAASISITDYGKNEELYKQITSELVSLKK
jgi:large subunit ribosomal protein L7Ae